MTKASESIHSILLACLMAVAGLVAGCDDQKNTPKAATGGRGAESSDDQQDGDKDKKKKPKPSKDDDEEDDEELPDIDTSGLPGSNPPPANPGPTPNEPQPQAVELRTIYRLFLPGVEHLYSTDPNEGVGVGYQPEGPVFKLAVQSADGLMPILRCRIGGTHFLSIDPGCEGQTSEGVLGYISAGARPNTIPIVRCHNATITDFLATNQDECVAAGYTIQGPLGYAPTDGFSL